MTVKFKVEFECYPPVNVSPTITFSHWLPVSDQHAIRVVEDNIAFKFWFEEKCTWWASQPSLEELKKHVNVEARYVNIELQMTDVPEEVAAYMQNRDFSRLPNDSEQELQKSYDKIGEQIFFSVLKRINRLIAFSRSRKGQYWVTEFSLDPSQIYNFFIRGHALGRCDDGTWFRFQPNGGVLKIIIENDNRYIKEAEWPEINNFVLGNQKTKLTGELLAGAEYLLSAGQRRSSITEAVTALEICLYDFGRNPDINKTFGDQLKNRIGNMSLKSQIEHMGLSGSVRYLLPLILPEEVMPIEILKECEIALTHRQNIVHNGQRDINEANARKTIINIRRCCEILESLTSQSE